MTNITTISIPKPLADKIKQRIKDTGFNSVSSYVTYVLRQVLSNIEEKEKKAEPRELKDTKEPKEAFSKDDEEKVKARLRSLGYID